MSEQAKVIDVVFDDSIYPRSEWSQVTIDRYAEALTCGDQFPPIILEPGTNRIWDGYHRWQSHVQAGREEIAVIWQECPEGVPPKLFAASFSVKHGDRISSADLRAVAREIFENDPDYNIDKMATHCGVSTKTVSNWVGDIKEKRILLRRAKVLLLSRGGWTNVRIGAALGVDESTVREDRKVPISPNLTEAFLRGVAAQLPDSDLDIDHLIDLILYADEEAEAKADVLEHWPDLAADVENPEIKYPANYRQARALALEKDEKERKRREREERERQEYIKRDGDRLKSFLRAYDAAYSLRADAAPPHVYRDEVLGLLDRNERKRFEQIDEETRWPSHRI